MPLPAILIFGAITLGSQLIQAHQQNEMMEAQKQSGQATTDQLMQMNQQSMAQMRMMYETLGQQYQMDPHVWDTIFPGTTSALPGSGPPNNSNGNAFYQQGGLA